MPSIFAQYLKPPKSMVEFGAELDVAEANRLSLAKARREGVQAEKSIAEQNALQRALAGGLDLATPEGVRTGLGVSVGGTLDAAKRLAEAKKLATESDTSKKRGDLYSVQEYKTKLEADIKERDDALQHVSALKTMEEAVADITDRVERGVLKPRPAMSILHGMPPPGSPPEAFGEWKKITETKLKTAQQRAQEEHQNLVRWLTERGQNMTAQTADRNREARAPTLAAQARAANAIADGRALPGTEVSIGGGMTAPAPGPRGVAPPPINASDLPQTQPVVTAANEQEALQRALQQDAAGVPTRILVPGPENFTDVQGGAVRTPDTALAAPTGTAAPLVADVNPRQTGFVPPPDDPTLTRDQNAQRRMNLERDFYAARNRVGVAQDKAGMKVTVMGANESAQLNRVLMGGNQTAKALGNIVNLPISVSSGIFGGRQQGKSLFEAGKEALTNTMTTQEVQSYNTLTTGIQRALAAIESSGLAPSNSLMHMMNNVVIKEGDTHFTKLLKLAETRQVVEAGYEVILANPRVSESQKKQAQTALDEIRANVPFTPLQVLQLGTLQQQNPDATMKDIMMRAKAGATPAVGERRQINGVPAEWDGKGWKRVP